MPLKSCKNCLGCQRQESIFPTTLCNNYKYDSSKDFKEIGNQIIEQCKLVLSR